MLSLRNDFHFALWLAIREIGIDVAGRRLIGWHGRLIKSLLEVID